MPECTIPYIPEHLHQNDKPIIPEFFNSEELYWRLGKNSLNAPYSAISLYDVSCNRSGIEPNRISYEDDVLWNIEPDASEQKYISSIVTLSIERIFQNIPPCKEINDDSNKQNIKVVLMLLVHDPLPCNYAHSLFVFELRGTRVTKPNYEETLGAKANKNLRKACRDELHKGIIRKKILI